MRAGMTFKSGERVVHLGGVRKELSRNRGMVLTILEGPVRIVGYTGERYIVDQPIFPHGSEHATLYHANAKYLLALRYAKTLGLA